MRVVMMLLVLAVSAFSFSGRVRSADGTVMIERNDRYWTVLDPDDAVSSGDSIRTAEGMCSIASADCVLMIGSNTIVTFERTGERLDILAGTVLLDMRAGEHTVGLPALEVRSRNARIFVRAGTVSRVAADDRSGAEIDVSARGKNNEAIRLKPGMTVYGKADGGISAEVPITDEQKNLFKQIREGKTMRPVKRTNTAPVPAGKHTGAVSLTEPAEDIIISGNAVTCRGYTVPGTLVTINGFLLSVESNGAFGPASIYLPRDGKNQIDVAVTGTQMHTNFSRTVYAEHSPPVIRDVVFSGLRDGAALTPEVRMQVKAVGAVRVSANGFPLDRTGETVFEGSAVSFKSGALTLVIEAVSRGGVVSRSERMVVFDIDTPFLIVREPIRLPLLTGVSSRSARITVRINDSVVIDKNAAGGSFSFDLSRALAPYRGHNVKISVSCEDVYGRSGTSFAVTRYFDL